MESLYRLRHWWLEHKKPVSRFGSIGLIVVILALLVFRWRASQDEKAAALTGIAFVEFGRENYSTVIAQLSPYVEEYSGLKAFGNGLFLLARSELLVGDSARAEEHYHLYLEDYGKDPLLKAGAMVGLGVIAEGRGDHGTAADYFQKASRAATTASHRQRYAIWAGRNYLLSLEPEAALALLEPLLDSDNLDFQAQNEIQELTASARSLVGERRRITP